MPSKSKSKSSSPKKTQRRFLSALVVPVSAPLSVESKSDDRQKSRSRSLGRSIRASRTFLRSKSPVEARLERLNRDAKTVDTNESTRSRSVEGRASPRKRSLSRGRRASRSKSRDRRTAQNRPVVEIGSTTPESITPLPGIAAHNVEDWQQAIGDRDWVLVEHLLAVYDFKHFKGKEESKPQRKLRVMRLFPNKQGSPIDDTKWDGPSPLLQGDSMGRTPLHLACKEHMPATLIHRLYFMERDAAHVKDSEGRYPLHIAAISHLDIKALDRLIRSNPDALSHPDNMTRTPIQYAILRADHKQNKESVHVWRHPTTKSMATWQAKQLEIWKNVQFILDAYLTRRKPLSKVHEKDVLLWAIDLRAPPAVVIRLLAVSSKMMSVAVATQVFQQLFKLQYPHLVVQKALKVCCKTLNKQILSGVLIRGLLDHFEHGCQPIYREKAGYEIAFVKELLQWHQRQGDESTLGDPCNEWREKLKFFLAFCSPYVDTPGQLHYDHMVHVALMIPETPLSMLELITRLSPANFRSIKDPKTGAYPLHLACRYWGSQDCSKENEKRLLRVLKLLVGEETDLLRRKYEKRIPLHHAILSEKPMSFTKAVVKIDRKTAAARDPITQLFPFQLAALPNRRNQRNAKEQVELIYGLLQAQPTCICPARAFGTGDSKVDTDRLALHVLNWCYSYSTKQWALHEKRIKVFRMAINNASIPSVMSDWWKRAREIIWKTYDDKNAGKLIACMPRNNEFLLHAALSNGNTPPILVELLLELYPASVMMKIPGTDEYPIHLAAREPAYNRFPFEATLSMDSALEMIALSFPEAASFLFRGGSPLQMAIGCGKTWKEVKCLLKLNPNSLVSADPITGLFPFQQMASMETCLPSYIVARKKTTMVRWHDQTAKQNARILKNAQREYHLDKLSSTFEILRMRPSALQGKVPFSARPAAGNLAESLAAGVEIFTNGSCWGANTFASS